jgi:hypothetical protein
MYERKEIEFSEDELLTKAYDRYFCLQTEAEQKEYENMRNRKSERLGPQCIVLNYSQPERTAELERIAMKNLAEEVGKYITSGYPADEIRGIITARLFFGNYTKQNHPGNRGRGWCDADLAVWLNWIRSGMPDGEWHLYYGKLLKSHLI